MTTVSINTIPEEILKEILADALIVPDDDFSKADGPSPFGHILTSSSEILLINKRWLRIATPFLYECIVLRNTPQAQAFHKTLRGKLGPQLKRFVRRVRLEASFGAFTDKIFTALPGITDLFLRLPSNLGEIVNGTVKGLPKLSPTRVIFEFTDDSLWKNTFMMAEALCRALRTWKTLVSPFPYVHAHLINCLLAYNFCNKNTFKLHVSCFSIESSGSTDNERSRLDKIAEALSVAPHLQFAILSCSRMGELSSTVEFVKKIGTNDSLQSIHLLLPSQQMLDQILEGLLGDPCAKIVQCSLKSVPISFRLFCYSIVLIFLCSPALSPEMTIDDQDGTVQVPQLPDKIIKTILDIYLRSLLSRISFESNTMQVKEYRKRCIDLMIVSKRFHVSPCSLYLTASLTNLFKYLHRKSAVLCLSVLLMTVKQVFRHLEHRGLQRLFFIILLL